MPNQRVLNYFGSKVLNARRYPPPEHGTIIEPFAGGAGYSLLYPDREVVLVDRSPDVTDAWSWLIQASPKDVLALPLLEPKQPIRELDIPRGAKLLIGWSCGQTLTPMPYLSSWAEYHNARGAGCYWGPVRRARMAELVPRIRHWMVFRGSYRQLRDVRATWFVDPPYVGCRPYPHDDVVHEDLAVWCRERRGQTIVCERAGATWLPFRPLYESPTSKRYLEGASQRCKEAVWTNDD